MILMENINNSQIKARFKAEMDASSRFESDGGGIHLIWLHVEFPNWLYYENLSTTSNLSKRNNF